LSANIIISIETNNPMPALSKSSKAVPKAAKKLSDPSSRKSGASPPSVGSQQQPQQSLSNNGNGASFGATQSLTSSIANTRAILTVFEKYQKERLGFVQTIADFASREHNIEVLQTAGVMALLKPLLGDPVPAIQQAAAVALGR
jgi:hypothetical protein